MLWRSLTLHEKVDSSIQRFMIILTVASTGFEKADKLALRKRAKYFDVRGTKLVYLGGPASKCLADKDFKSLIVIFLNYRIYSF